jgi:hypothetical protein
MVDLRALVPQVLAPLSGTDADPFDGAQVDINALGEQHRCHMPHADHTW